jgi:hypothetical protein
MNIDSTKETTPRDQLDKRNIRETPLGGLIKHKERINVAWRTSKRQTIKESTHRHDQNERTYGEEDQHTKKRINVARKTKKKRLTPKEED